VLCIRKLGSKPYVSLQDANSDCDERSMRWYEERCGLGHRGRAMQLIEPDHGIAAKRHGLRIPMGYPRQYLACADTHGFCHCVSRCVCDWVMAVGTRTCEPSNAATRFSW
jgi:hypothetical protein